MIPTNEQVFERPPEPRWEDQVWYCGWEAGYNDMAMRYANEGWIAYRGGCDLDATKVTAKSWLELLDIIDD